jgi:Flp pilus assembly pilin Flp
MEYALLGRLMAVVIILAVTTFGGRVPDLFRGAAGSIPIS